MIPMDFFFSFWSEIPELSHKIFFLPPTKICDPTLFRQSKLVRPKGKKLKFFNLVVFGYAFTWSDVYKKYSDGIYLWERKNILGSARPDLITVKMACRRW
jgi:hypothetical protein